MFEAIRTQRSRVLLKHKFSKVGKINDDVNKESQGNAPYVADARKMIKKIPPEVVLFRRG